MNKTNPRSVIVVGRASPGETIDTAMLQRHFGLELLLADWHRGQYIPHYNTLVLTADFPQRVTHCDVVRLEDVIAIAKAA